jgi:hypothetical protein
MEALKWAIIQEEKLAAFVKGHVMESAILAYSFLFLSDV